MQRFIPFASGYSCATEGKFTLIWTNKIMSSGGLRAAARALYNRANYEDNEIMVILTATRAYIITHDKIEPTILKYLHMLTFINRYIMFIPTHRNRDKITVQTFDKNMNHHKSLNVRYARRKYRIPRRFYIKKVECQLLSVDDLE